MKKQTKVRQLNEYFDLETSLDNAIKNLSEIRKKHQDKSNLRLEMSWGEDYRELKIYYDEVESDKEYQERLAAEEQSQQNRFKLFQQLQKEFSN